MKTVLVIEDEQQTRNVFVKCLTFEGFRAYGAGNGSEGIQLAQKYHPDLVVCDIMMPDMDGYSVLSTLRRSPLTAAIPLIFLTAKVTMADLRRGMELGADDYLTKPCTIEQFLSAITSRLKRHAEIATAIQSPPPTILMVRRPRRDRPTASRTPQFFPTVRSWHGFFNLLKITIVTRLI
jgi:CheY-like chemotaxis protein